MKLVVLMAVHLGGIGGELQREEEREKNTCTLPLNADNCHSCLAPSTPPDQPHYLTIRIQPVHQRGAAEHTHTHTPQSYWKVWHHCDRKTAMDLPQ